MQVFYDSAKYHMFARQATQITRVAILSPKFFLRLHVV